METESLFCAAQEQAIRTIPVNHSLGKISETPLCRFCNQKIKDVAHIMSVCHNQAKNQYRKRHHKVTKNMDWLLCKKTPLKMLGQVV